MLDALRFHAPDGRAVILPIGARMLSIVELPEGSRIEIDVGDFTARDTTRSYFLRETPAEVEAILEARVLRIREENVRIAEAKKAHRAARVRVRQMPLAPTLEEAEIDEGDLDLDPMTLHLRGGGMSLA